MSVPTEKQLRAVYKKHGGNFAKIAQALGRPTNTVKAWYYRHGIEGRGVGGNHRRVPPPKELKALHKRYDGNLAAVANHLGIARSAVHVEAKKIGLSGEGRKKFQPIYPMRLPLSIKDGCVVIYSDAHFWPAARSRAYEALLIALRKLQPEAIIGNGDLLDGAKISRHDPIGWDDLPTLEDELNEGRVRQAEIARAAPEAEKIGTIGNHDARFEKYVIKYARELEGVPGMRLADHFPDWRICWSVMINSNVVVKHRFRGGIHATYNNTLHAGLTIVTGHLHSQNVRAKTDYNGTRWGIDAGMLADRNGPQFLYLEDNPADWRSGFCILEFENGKLLPPLLATVLDDGGVIMQRQERLL